MVITYEQIERLRFEAQPGMHINVEPTGPTDDVGRSDIEVKINWIDGFRRFTVPVDGSGYFDRQKRV